ncbi:MAG: HigA family addiction module antitoxin [Thermodesulfobacteriota bacterium]
MREESSAPIHPGEVLLDQFILPNYQTMSKAAQALEVPMDQLLGVISCEERLSEALAWRLAQHFGLPMHFWLRLQGQWDRQAA